MRYEFYYPLLAGSQHSASPPKARYDPYPLLSRSYLVLSFSGLERQGRGPRRWSPSYYPRRAFYLSLFRPLSALLALWQILVPRAYLMGPLRGCSKGCDLGG